MACPDIIREIPDLFRKLIIRHYDPLYARSQHKNFQQLNDSRRLMTDDLSEEGGRGLAAEVVA